MDEIDKMESNESFDKMSLALDTEFDGAIIETKLNEIDEVKNEISTALSSDNVSFEDKNYLQVMLKTVIETSMSVMKVCGENIKIGSNARDKEVFFNGAGKLVEACRELRELNKTVSDIKIKENQSNTPSTNNNLTVNMKMSGRDMLKYLNNLEDAQKSNQLKTINADFDGAGE